MKRFPYLRIIGRRDSVEVSRDLRSQIGDDDELLENVLWEDVSVTGLLDVVGGDVDVIGPEMQIGGGNGADSPLGLRGERRCLVIRSR